MQPDLIISAGRVCCPRQGIDRPGSVSMQFGKIVDCDADPSGIGRCVREYPDAILLPGLIDLHGHPARSHSIWGVDPDAACLPFGTTTILSQGDAGADHLDEFVRNTASVSRTRVRLAINLSRFGESRSGGCLQCLDDADVKRCAAAIREAGPLVWGVACNVSHHACPAVDPREVVRRALLVAEETGKPILFGPRRPEDWSLAEQFDLLRPGDVVTYCYRSQPYSLVERGRIRPEIREARERGVLFDVGHGRSSFDFTVAEAALGEGFPPDTISTDIQRAHLGESPPHTLLRVAAKLIAAGMIERDVFAAITSTPARVMGLHGDLGSLSIGSCADLVVVRRSGQPEWLRDTSGQVRRGHSFEPLLVVRSGSVVVDHAYSLPPSAAGR